VFYSYFEYLCKQKGVSKNKACQDMGVSRNVAAKWKATNTNPNMATLKKISEYFNVSIDELIAQDKEKPATNSDGQEADFDLSNLNENQRAAIDALRKLNPQNLAAVRPVIESLVSSQQDQGG